MLFDKHGWWQSCDFSAAMLASGKGEEKNLMMYVEEHLMVVKLTLLNFESM